MEDIYLLSNWQWRTVKSVPIPLFEEDFHFGLWVTTDVHWAVFSSKFRLIVNSIIDNYLYYTQFTESSHSYYNIP